MHVICCALLAVLVLAHRGATQCTDASADHGVLATLGRAAAGQQAGGRTNRGTDQRVAAGAVLLLGRVAVLVALHVGAAGGTGGQLCFGAAPHDRAACAVLDLQTIDEGRVPVGVPVLLW